MGPKTIVETEENTGADFVRLIDQLLLPEDGDKEVNEDDAPEDE